MIGTQSDKVSRVNSDVKMNSHYLTVSLREIGKVGTIRESPYTSMVGAAKL